MVSSDCRYASRSSSGVKSSSSEAGNPSEFDRSYQIPSFLPPLHPPQSQPPARPPHPLTAMWSAPTGIDSVRRPKKGRSNSSVFEFASAIRTPLAGTFFSAAGRDSVALEVASEPIRSIGNGLHQANPASTGSSEICHPSRHADCAEGLDNRETGASGRISVMASGTSSLSSSTQIPHSNMITREHTRTGKKRDSDSTLPAPKQCANAPPAPSSCPTALPGAGPTCSPSGSSHFSSFEKLPSRPMSPRSQGSLESCVSAGSGSMTLIEGSIELVEGTDVPLLMAADEQCHEVAEVWVDKHWRSLQSLWISSSSALYRNGGSKGSGDVCRQEEAQEETAAASTVGSSSDGTFLRRELAIKKLTKYLKQVEEEAEVLPTTFNEKWLTILNGR
eukprot:GHVS01036982.1.p1 GENE.GHVS01036982.1~~GHVS01036982.1.p1  ORF type:complete len:390 (+),score=51.98 GHVS01036982.1:1139-2308(+)